jgi:hypothetical protein
LSRKRGIGILPMNLSDHGQEADATSERFAGPTFDRA